MAGGIVLGGKKYSVAEYLQVILDEHPRGSCCTRHPTKRQPVLVARATAWACRPVQAKSTF
eukprot:scaffold127308_cov36-Tisochrysis_lutea.AAC.3